jgi:hypothetical protein
MNNGMADLESAFDKAPEQTPAPAPTRGPRAYNNRPEPRRSQFRERYPIVGTESGRNSSQSPNLSSLPKAQPSRPKYEHPAAQSAGKHLQHQASPIWVGDHSEYGEPRCIPRAPVRPQRPMLKIIQSIMLNRVAKKRDNDFCEVEERELLFTPLTLPVGAYADDDEGLARSFIGLNTAGRTTIGQIREVEMTTADFERKVFNYLMTQTGELAINHKKVAKTITDKTLAIAAKYKINEVIEYRDGRDSVR